MATVVRSKTFDLDVSHTCQHDFNTRHVIVSVRDAEGHEHVASLYHVDTNTVVVDPGVYYKTGKSTIWRPDKTPNLKAVVYA